MFFFDAETTDIESTTGVLSVALLYADNTMSYQDMLDNTLFVKFDMSEQIKLKRTFSKATLAWWEKQPAIVRDKSIKPSSDDVSIEVGIGMIRNYINNHNKKSLVWARGFIDQMCMESLCNSVNIDPIFPYYNWRDIRTAIDIIYGTTNGYCDIIHPEFKQDMVIKHLPYHDVCLDAMMLYHGKEK